MATKRSSKAREKRTVADPSSHIIPGPVSDETLNRFKLDPENHYEAKRIAEYVEQECAKDKEKVTYLEKIKTENVLGSDFDCWHVRTDKEDHWVITNPTNLYTHKMFPSLDYTLSFHIGLMARLQSKRKGASDERVGDLLAAAFRRWEQAAEALDAGTESEDIQAVGMRCRECLIAFARSAAKPSMVPAGGVAPKTADFIHWSELIAEAVAAGSRMAEVRRFLKTTARSTWQMASWLTHATNAIRYDGMLVVDATYAVLNAYGAALLRYEHPTADRCSRCNSVKIRIVDDVEFDSGSAIVCESCGVVEDAAKGAN
jgi:hypothetical protein